MADEASFALLSEAGRLRTFARWPPSAPVSGEQLARAGFYYSGVDLEVTCFQCKVQCRDWQSGDVPLRKHGQLSPNCPYAKAQMAATEEANRLREPVSVELGGGGGVSRGGPVSQDSDVEATAHHLKHIRAYQKAWPGSFNFVCESERLKTFAEWPVRFIAPAALARAGFVYLRDGDRVQCVFCCGQVVDWEEGDVPTTEHARHFPYCPLVLGTSANIPDGAQPGTGRPPSTLWRPPTRPGYDVCGTRDSAPEQSPPSSANAGFNNNNEMTADRSGEQLSALNVVPHGSPSYPKFATRDARLKSYQSWNPATPQNINSLVEAGLFYVGTGDQVKCFQCGGGLQNWEAKDLPWEEHARWFPLCNFVVLNKGRDYVERSKKHRPPVLPQNENGTETVSLPQTAGQRPYTDGEIDVLMNDDITKAVLDLGFEPSTVREVLRRRMEQAGYQFTNADLLATAVLEHGDGITSTPKNSETTVTTPVASQVGSTEEGPAHTVVNMMPEVAYGEKTVPPTVNGLTSTATSSMGTTSEQEIRLCKVCMDEEMNVVFLPCGHFMACTSCASVMTDCPVCRQPIKGTVRTYWP